MWTCNRMELQTLGSQLVVMPNNLPDHWYQFKASLALQCHLGGWQMGTCNNIRILSNLKAIRLGYYCMDPSVRHAAAPFWLTDLSVILIHSYKGSITGSLPWQGRFQKLRSKTVLDLSLRNLLHSGKESSTTTCDSCSDCLLILHNIFEPRIRGAQVKSSGNTNPGSPLRGLDGA